MQETIASIAQGLGYPYQQKGEGSVTGIAIDSRKAGPGDLFVAIVGERTDGHQYIQQALSQGAAGVVISRPDQVDLTQVDNYILAEDGVELIQQLAGWLRRKMDIPVIAVTGSTGKTSTKDFLTSLLAPLGNLVVTKGNHNNELGMPLTLCQLEPDTKAVVVEMGMRGLGQIDFLCQIAQPSHGLITNIGKTHCELLGSQENIARAKCELLTWVQAGGTVALNRTDEAFLKPWLDTCKGHIIWYHDEEKREGFWADAITETDDGIIYTLHWQQEHCTVTLPVHGVHNVSNSMAAIAIAYSLGVTWQQMTEALANTALTGMRLDFVAGKHGVTIINDAYNANPDSMKSAISVLMHRSGGKKIAVLGDMYELGQYEVDSHQEVGVAAAQAGVDTLVAVGALGRIIGDTAAQAGCSVVWAADNREAIAWLRQNIQPGDVMLVKGSRGMQMEQIVQEFMG